MIGLLLTLPRRLSDDTGPTCFRTPPTRKIRSVLWLVAFYLQAATRLARTRALDVFLTGDAWSRGRNVVVVVRVISGVRSRRWHRVVSRRVHRCMTRSMSRWRDGHRRVWRCIVVGCCLLRRIVRRSILLLIVRHSRNNRRRWLRGRSTTATQSRVEGVLLAAAHDGGGGSWTESVSRIVSRRARHRLPASVGKRVGRRRRPGQSFYLPRCCILGERTMRGVFWRVNDVQPAEPDVFGEMVREIKPNARRYDHSLATTIP